MTRFHLAPALLAASLLTSCVTSSRDLPPPNAEVISDHAGIYIRIPSTNPPKTAPYLYLQRGMEVHRTGKTRRGYERIIVADGLNCWVDQDLLGPIESANDRPRRPQYDMFRPTGRQSY